MSKFLRFFENKISKSKTIFTILGMSTCWWRGVVWNGATFANVWLRGFVWHHRKEVFQFSPLFRWSQFYFDRNSFQLLKNYLKRIPEPSAKLENTKKTALKLVILYKDAKKAISVLYLMVFDFSGRNFADGIGILQKLKFRSKKEPAKYKYKSYRSRPFKVAD